MAAANGSDDRVCGYRVQQCGGSGSGSSGTRGSSTGGTCASCACSGSDGSICRAGSRSGA